MTKPNTRGTRQRVVALLTTEHTHIAASADEARVAGKGLDAGAPNPVFAESARRHALIEKAAYLRAEHRGFEPGHELEDWCEAEREIDTQLFRGDTPPL